MAYQKIRKNGQPAKPAGKKPNPNAKPKKAAVFVAGVLRPHVWLCGPDEYKHSMYHPWQMSKAQAKFRGEDWTLEFEEYYELWKDDWNNRGRDPENMCMSRMDSNGPWSLKNAIIITRAEQLEQNGFQRRGIKYKPRSLKVKK